MIYETQDASQQQGAMEALRESIKRLEEANLRFRAAGDASAEADTLVKLAAVYLRLSENRLALGSYNQALTLYRAQNNRSGEAAALNGIGSAHGRLSEYQKAIDAYQKAQPLFRAENNPSGEAAALAGIGAAYLRLNDYQKALDVSHQALSLYRSLGDRSGEASMLQQIGYLHFVQDEYPQAFESYDKALALARAAGDQSREAGVLQTIGRAHFRRGNYQKALDLYAEALALERATQNRSGEAILLGAMGQVYRSLGENQKALEYLNQSLVVFRASGERLNEATSLNLSAHVYLSMGEYQQALSLFEKSLEICRLISNRAGEASNTNGLGLAHAGLGEYQKALESHRHALELFRAIGHRRAEGDSLSHIGRGYLSLGEHQKALGYLNDALDIYRGVRALREESQALYSMARAYQAAGNLIDARAKIEAAIRLAEATRQDVASQQLRSSYLASVRGFYELNIDVLMQLHKQNPEAGFAAGAFEASERARARSLLDLLAEARTDIRQGVEPALLERERSLHDLIAARAERQAQLLNSKSAPDQLAAVAREIETTLADYQDVQAKIRNNSPRYAALMHPQPLTLSQIQTEVLDGETVLLEYFLGARQSYLWAVTHNSVAAYELAGSGEIEKVSRRFYELLKTNTNNEALKQTANQLAEMLLAPAAAQLGEKRLAIVADGALHYVPFAALPAPVQRSEVRDPQSTVRTRASNYTPLIVEHEVVSLPSASILAVLKKEMKGRKPAPKLVAVVADPVFDANDVRVRRGPGRPINSAAERAAHVRDSGLVRSVRETGLAQGAWPLPRLLGTRREARAILSLSPVLKSRQALDFEASRETAAGGDLGTYQVIHFATHALINNQHPELSGLVLSLVDEQGRPQDGFLRLNDIYNLQLPAELVVLSACQTGLGKEIRGEGLIGLTRGFMYAGAPRVITSLWQVDDKATSELMGRFYRGLLGDKKLSAAGALREAQVGMWRQKGRQSAYYWAAFALQGEWN